MPLDDGELGLDGEPPGVVERFDWSLLVELPELPMPPLPDGLELEPEVELPEVELPLDAPLLSRSQPASRPLNASATAAANAVNFMWSPPLVWSPSTSK